MEKRFLADFMLGRLARWLRVLGYDTIYSRKGIESVLMVKAYREDRIILTRNTRLFKRIDPERRHGHRRGQISRRTPRIGHAGAEKRGDAGLTGVPHVAANRLFRIEFLRHFHNHVRYEHNSR
ncbi:MAG: Mut7-C RNAse domain-containing protein, partial [bacterium]